MNDCLQCGNRTEKVEQVNKIDLLRHRNGEPLFVTRYCKYCGIPYQQEFRLDGNPDKDGTHLSMGELNLNWSVNPVQDLEDYIGRFNYFSTYSLELREIGGFRRGNLMAIKFNDGFRYERIFYIPWFSLLETCQCCGLLGRTTKIKNRYDIFNWNLKSGGDYNKTILCHKCYRKMNLLRKQWESAEKNRKVLKQLKEAIRDERKARKNPDKDNRGITGIPCVDDGSGETRGDRRGQSQPDNQIGRAD